MKVWCCLRIFFPFLTATACTLHRSHVEMERDKLQYTRKVYYCASVYGFSRGSQALSLAASVRYLQRARCVTPTARQITAAVISRHRLDNSERRAAHKQPSDSLSRTLAMRPVLIGRDDGPWSCQPSKVARMPSRVQLPINKRPKPDWRHGTRLRQ